MIFRAQKSLPAEASTGAFTLIEVMIVMFIMAIVMATGVPAIFRAMEKDALRQGVNAVVEACSHARAQAILNGVPMQMVIRAEDGAIMVRKPSSREAGDSLDEAPLVPLAATEEEGSNGFHAVLDENIAVELIYLNFKDMMDATETAVSFYPNGTSDEFSIVLSSTDGSYKISLDVITGLATSDRLQ